MQELEQSRKAEPDEIDLMALFQVVWKQRWLVVIVTSVFLVGGVIAALVWPKTYEATATVFPISSSSGSSALSEYSGLASLAGISLPSAAGASSPGKTVNALLASRILVERLVDDYLLLEKIPVDGQDDQTKRRSLVSFLRKNLKTKEDAKTGVISVTVSLSDPELAMTVTNQALKVLDELLVQKSFTANQKKQEQLERQIQEQGVKLSSYQQQMAEFQRQTALLAPSTQAGKIVDAYTQMIQQKMELELQLATAQASYSSNNPRVTLLQAQLHNLEGQIAEVRNQVDGDLPSLKMAPENLIRYQNLMRDLEISTKIYATLLASLEQAKLDQDKEQVYIEVLDEALLPTYGSPGRSLIVLGATALGFLTSLIFVFVLAALDRVRALSYELKQELGAAREP